jgi:hypothetical protein
VGATMDTAAMASRLDTLSAELAAEREARMRLEAAFEDGAALRKVELDLSEGLDILANCVSEQAALAQRSEQQVAELAALSRRVENTERKFDSSLDQHAGEVEAQLRQLDGSVRKDLESTKRGLAEILNGGGAESGPKSAARRRQQQQQQGGGGVSRFAPTSSAEQLEQQIRIASTPSAHEAAATAASDQGVPGVTVDGTSAQAICEAFSGVVRDLRAQLSALSDDRATTKASVDECLGLRTVQDALRRDFQVHVARSEQLSQGVDHVVDQLRNVEVFVDRTHKLSTEHNATTERLDWLELQVGKDEETGTASAVAMRLDLEKIQQAMDEVSVAVAADIRGLDVRTQELESSQLAEVVSNLQASVQRQAQVQQELWKQELDGAMSALTERVEASVDQAELSERLQTIEQTIRSHLDANFGEITGQLDEQRALAEQQEEQARLKRAEQLFQKAMGRMRNMSTATCMEAWKQTVAEAKHQRRLIRKVAQRFQNRHLSQCYGRWASQVRASQRQRQLDAAAEQRQFMSTVMARLDPDGDGVVDKDEFTEWAKGQAFRVESWKQELDGAMSALTQEMHGAAQRLTERVEASVDQAELSERLQTIEQTIRSHLDANFGEITGQLDEQRALAEQQEEQARLKRAEQLFQKAMGRMRNMSTATCMEAWTQTVAEAKHQRRLIRKVAQRFQNRHLSQCYGRWAAQVRASQRQRELEHVESWKQKLQSSISKLEGDLSTMSNDFQESIQDLTARVQADQHSVTEMTDQLHDSLQALTTRIDSTVCADEFADVVRRVSVPPPSTRPFLVAVYSHYIALRRLMELRHGRTRRQFGCPLRSGHN